MSNMNVSVIELSWFIGLKFNEQNDRNGENANNYFKELLPIKRYGSIKSCNCLYYGSYLFNLLNIRDIENSRDSKSNENFNHFHKLFEEIIMPECPIELSNSFQGNSKSPSNYISLFYDILGFLSFCTIYKILSFINKFHYNISNGEYDKINIDNFRDIFSDEISSGHTIQEQIIKYCESINLLLIKTDQNAHLYPSEAKELFNEIKDRLQNESKKSKYITDYCNSQRGRCFAYYISSKKDRYITFSGFPDSEEQSIVDVLNESDHNNKYPSCLLEIIKDLTRKLGATLIQTSLDVKKYSIDEKGKVCKSTSINDLIKSNSLLQERMGYSCCERKIFAHFNDKTPSGKLYIKFRPCGECYLGILFQLQEGSKLTWELFNL